MDSNFALKLLKRIYVEECDFPQPVCANTTSDPPSLQPKNSVFQCRHIEEKFRHFLSGMLMDPADHSSTADSQTDCSTLYYESSVDDEADHYQVLSNGVYVNVGRMDHHLAALWWALAQQTARVAQQSDTRSVASRGNSIRAETPESEAAAFSRRTGFDMDSARLVRAACESLPRSSKSSRNSRTSAFIGGIPLYDHHVEGIQLTRFIHAPPQSASLEFLPDDEPEDPPRSLHRPKSELLNRKFQRGKMELESEVERKNSSLYSSGCLVYESQYLGRDDEVPAGSGLAGRFQPMVVVAIDFGTTYSGYAFSFVNDPENIHMMRKWEGGDPGIPNAKTPTVLLLNPNQEFHSFGYTARDFYHDLPSRDARLWLYFDKFKMTLHHQKQLARESPVVAANGETLPLIVVFAHALNFFRQHALKELSDHTGTNILNEDVRWVITVPAIWRPAAKQLMREAAYKAGIGSPQCPEQVLIALEPEAAALFCRQLKRHQLMPDRPPELHLSLNYDPAKPQPLKPWSAHRESVMVEPILHDMAGKKYIVVDCGGGTVDITVHEVKDNEGQTLKELHRATGGPYGSIGVDLAFERLMEAIFGQDFMSHFRMRYPAAYVDLMVAFEARKRHASPFRCNPLNVALPFSFIDCYRKFRGKEVDWAVRKHNDPHVRWSSQGMLRLDQNAMKELFAPTVGAIIEHIQDILNHPDIPGIDFLFLVGGFAESPLLQQAIKNAFHSTLTVIIPQDVSLAIVKGAVLYGVDPSAICVRRSHLTYGVAVLNRFIHGRHQPAKLVVKDGVEYCRDIYDKFVVADQSIIVGERVVRSYSPVRVHQKRIVLNVYCAQTDDADFVTDDGVSLCATLSLDLVPQIRTEAGRSSVKAKREIRVTMEFGDTEIKATALDVATGNYVGAKFDFLHKC